MQNSAAVPRTKLLNRGKNVKRNKRKAITKQRYKPQKTREKNSGDSKSKQEHASATFRVQNKAKKLKKRMQSDAQNSKNKIAQQRRPSGLFDTLNNRPYVLIRRPLD